MSKVRNCFKSRFDNGWIVEADFSQLEVIYLAHITKDENLHSDIVNDVDMHTESAAKLFGIPKHEVTKEQRKVAKGFSFMLQYGSSAKGMAQQTGLPIELAEQFIANYYDRYPAVKEWQDRNIEIVNDSLQPTGKHDSNGDPELWGELSSETGRRYKFKTRPISPEYRAKVMKWKGNARPNVSPTTIKNYPIQGGATGDIVPMVLGKINRDIVQRGWVEKVKLIATVHDSIVLDVQDDMLYTVCKFLKKTMQDAPNLYRIYFDVLFDLPLKVDVEFGRSWGEITEKYDEAKHR